jgi:O-antigen/teichoic acid export membrane protein
VLAGILIPVTWLLNEPISDLFGDGQGGLTWVLAAAFVPVTFLDWTTHGQLQGMLEFGRFNVLLVASKVMYALTIIVLIGLAGVGVAGGLIAYIAGSVVMTAGALPPILARGRPRLDSALLRATLRYGSRVQVGSIFQTAMARLDVVILQFFRPLSQVGYYVVAQTIAEFLLQLTSSFQASVMPLVSHYEGDERQASTSADSVRHHGILAAAAVLANMIFGAFVILVMYGHPYYPALVPMLILLPGVWFLGTGGVIQSDLSGRGRPGISSALAGIAAAITVALDLALIPPLGVTGAAIASVIAYTAYGIGSLMVLHRVSGIAMRSMLMPTRKDLALYWGAISRLLRHIRPSIRRAA